MYMSAAAMFSTRTLMIISFSVAAFVLALVIYVARKRSSARNSVVLLVGPPDAGKTAILTSMVYNQTLQTHTSIQVNSVVVEASPTKRPLRVVDIPGHPRLRDEFKSFLPESKAIIFVVDASTISRNGAAVAEHLHCVLHALTTLPPTRTPPALCVLGHKSDLLTPSTFSSTPIASTQLSVARVRTILERELEKRRASQVGGVGIEGLGAEGDGAEMGGLECRSAGGIAEFRFVDWEGGEVAFFGTSVGREDRDEKSKVDEGDGLLVLREWIEELL